MKFIQVLILSIAALNFLTHEIYATPPLSDHYRDPYRDWSEEDRERHRDMEDRWAD